MIPFFLFLLGALIGGFINWYVDGIGLEPRFRSPWRKSGLAKRWFDYLPIFGWLSMRRFGGGMLHGLESRLFWLRPLLVELLTASGLVWLFHWEVEMQMLLPAGLTQESYQTVLLRFFVHVLLFAFLTAASLIDFDDMIIPDRLTVYGTMIGLLLAHWSPQMMLPATEIHWNEKMMSGYIVSPEAVPLNVCSPNPALQLWGGDSAKLSGNHIAWMLGLWLFWCFAMLDRVWYTQLPLRKAAAIFCRRLSRSPTTKIWIKIALVGPFCIAVPDVIWHWDSSYHGWNYSGLLSALFGMASGMILIWGIRLVAGRALGMEAMGFGDVTIMGVIGAFLGWQCTLLVLLFSLLPGLFFGVWNLISGKGQALPFGPFLCLGAGIVVLFWKPIWERAAETFELGWILGMILFVCLILLGVSLRAWRALKESLLSAHK